MRVVAGAARGHRLVAPRGRDVRPTTDRVKEALFSSLQPRLPGGSVLDAYAGSGALGLEAASRGAAHVLLVERHRRALAAIARNVAATGLDVTVVERDLGAVLADDDAPGAPWDVALLDPPYALSDDDLADVLAVLVTRLAAGAVVVVERATRSDAPRWPAPLVPGRVRVYGDTTLHVAEGPE